MNTVLGKASETTVIKYIHPGPKEENFTELRANPLPQQRAFIEVLANQS